MFKIVQLEDYVSNFDHLIDASFWSGEGDFLAFPRTAPGEVAARAVDADALLINKTLISRELLEQLPKLKYIGVLATVGVGMIPSSYPLPVVYMDSILPSEENSRCCVTCSNYRSAADMAETVISCGHKNILIFSSISPNEFSRRERLNGFVDTLKKHKIPDVSRRIISIMPGNYLNFSRIFQRAYKQFPETTLILTDSDDIAFNIVEDIRAMGIEDKITVTGFGNLSWITPLLKIPTVEQHPEETGAIAVDKLIYNIQHPDSPHTGNVIIEAELVHTDLIPDISKEN